MMKRVLRTFSIVLAIALMVQLGAPAAYAAEPAGKNTLVLLDKFIAEHYEIAAYRNGDTTYVITINGDGSIELSFVEKGSGTVKSLQISAQDTMPAGFSTASEIDLDDLDFAEAVISYGKAHQNQAVVAGVQAVSRSASADSAEATPTRNSAYDFFMGELEDIYGEEYYNYDWTGMTGNIIYGLTFNYKESLVYDVAYIDGIIFSEDSTLGEIYGLVTDIFDIPTSIETLIDVLQTVDEITAELQYDGVLASYYATAVFSRYVLVNGSGPYYECYKSTEYTGWLVEGNVSSAVLEEVGTRYQPQQSIFESYELQREIARDNYEQ